MYFDSFKQSTSGNYFCKCLKRFNWTRRKDICIRRIVCTGLIRKFGVIVCIVIGWQIFVFDKWKLKLGHCVTVSPPYPPRHTQWEPPNISLQSSNQNLQILQILQYLQILQCIPCRTLYLGNVLYSQGGPKIIKKSDVMSLPPVHMGDTTLNPYWAQGWTMKLERGWLVNALEIQYWGSHMGRLNRGTATRTHWSATDSDWTPPNRSKVKQK